MRLINQYEVIEEIGRGMHGKVKLARNLETGENVAIKIIPRFSKKRRLGKVTAMSPEDKTKKEIAILKKIRHPNVVALLELMLDEHGALHPDRDDEVLAGACVTRPAAGEVE